MGASWGLLGASWGLLWASWGGKLEFSVRGPPLGPLLEPSWGPFGPSWAPLGQSWGSLGPSWGPLGGLLGGLGAVLEASWAVLERREAETARRQKSVKNLRKMNDVGLVGLSWAASWRPLRVSWRPLGPSWAHLGRLGPIFRRLEAFLDHLVDHLGAVRASRKRVCRNGAVFCRGCAVFRRRSARGRGPVPGGPPQTPPGGH